MCHAASRGMNYATPLTSVIVVYCTLPYWTATHSPHCTETCSIIFNVVWYDLMYCGVPYCIALYHTMMHQHLLRYVLISSFAHPYFRPSWLTRISLATVYPHINPQSHKNLKIQNLFSDFFLSVLVRNFFRTFSFSSFTTASTSTHLIWRIRDIGSQCLNSVGEQLRFLPSRPSFSVPLLYIL